MSYIRYTEEKRSCTVDGQKIRGILYRPQQLGRIPLAVCSHGFASSHQRLVHYGAALARHGIAAYMIDYRGGSPTSISDGQTTDMTVMTEAADLLAVVAHVRTWDFVDPDQIVLLGTSQGGFASAIAAARIAPPIKALILIYPAFMLPDDVHREFASLEDIPDVVFYRQQMNVGRPYFADLWDYDPYAETTSYTGPVLIVHGTQDTVVPPVYSKRAARAYRNAQLKFIDGAEHGFSGASMAETAEDILIFLRHLGLVHCRS